MTTLASLEWLAAVSTVPVRPEGRVIVHVAVRTVDGAELAPADVFDLPAGGLVVVRDYSLDHTVELVTKGDEGPACVAAGVASPCLVPRLGDLARARLLTTHELLDTMSGAIEVRTTGGDATPPARGTALREPTLDLPVALLLTCAAGAALMTLALVIRSLRARGPLGAVRRAAGEARRATRRDGTLAHVRVQIERLVAHARDLEATRRACLAERARIDRGSLARGLAAERLAAARIDVDLARARADLDRVASALRLVALHAREHRTEPGPLVDPVAELQAELALRDEVIAEVNEVR